MVCILAFHGVLLMDGRVRAGAFLQDVDTGQVIVTTTRSASTRAFDASGRIVVATAPWQKYEISHASEHGITPWFTLLSSSVRDTLSYTNVGGKLYRTQLSSIGGRLAISQTEDQTISFEFNLRRPMRHSTPELISSDFSHALDLRLQAGTALTISGLDSFSDISIGYRRHTAGFAPQMMLDATLGVHINERYLVMLQQFATMTRASGQTLSSSNSKIQGSLVFFPRPNWALQSGVFTTIAGRNSAVERGMLVGVWRRM
jgi:hypothetical protein